MWLDAIPFNMEARLALKRYTPLTNTSQQHPPTIHVTTTYYTLHTTTHYTTLHKNTLQHYAQQHTTHYTTAHYKNNNNTITQQQSLTSSHIGSA